MCNGGDDGIAVEAFEVLPRRFAPLDDGVRTLPPIDGLRSRFQVDAVEHRFNCGDYSVKVIPLGLGLLHQHIKLCLGFMTVACKRYNVPSYKETTSTVILTRRYSPFSSSASLSARLDSFAFSYRSCSMAWRSWPSSASCSTSAIVTTKNMVVQQYKVHSPIYRTYFLLRYTSELFGFLFQLLGDTPQLSRDSSQLLGMAL